MARAPEPVWTRPIAGSPYPLTLAPAGSDPANASRRVFAVAAVVVLLAAYVIVVPLINTGVIYLGFVTEAPGTNWAAYSKNASGFGTVWGVLAAHLGLAAMIFVVWGLFHFMHHRPLSWLWSVSPGVRWRYAFLAFVASAVLLGAYAAYNWVRSDGWNPPDGWVWYVVVVVLTTPFQALAEEVMFRGYLMGVFGLIMRNVWFPVVGTALVFALMHGVQNPWLFADRFAFGLLAGVLVWKTGGLEAAVAIHVVNNLCAFGLGIATGTLAQTRTTTAVGWSQAAWDVGTFAACAAACWGIARWLRVPVKVKEG